MDVTVTRHAETVASLKVMRHGGQDASGPSVANDMNVKHHRGVSCYVPHNTIERYWSSSSPCGGLDECKDNHYSHFQNNAENTIERSCDGRGSG